MRRTLQNLPVQQTSLQRLQVDTQKTNSLIHATVTCKSFWKRPGDPEQGVPIEQTHNKAFHPEEASPLVQTSVAVFFGDFFGESGLC